MIIELSENRCLQNITISVSLSADCSAARVSIVVPFFRLLGRKQFEGQCMYNTYVFDSYGVRPSPSSGYSRTEFGTSHVAESHKPPWACGLQLLESMSFGVLGVSSVVQKTA